MASSTGKWEVVGKPSKIPKKKDSVNGAKPTKFSTSSMPTIDALDQREPVKETPTIYDAFIAKEKPSPKPKKQIETITAQGNKKAGPQTKKKTASEQRTTRKVSLEEAIRKIDYDTVAAVLEKDQATFPDNPTVWLMDLATYVNCNLDSVAEPDPVFEGKPKDYPLSAFPKTLQNLFEDVLKQCSEKTQKAFMEACIKAMINDMGKGISTFGFRMVIQLLARLKPDIVSSDYQKYLTLLKESQSRYLRCLSVMWAVSQVGYHDMQQGLNVWFELLVPFLNVRNLAPFIVEYIVVLFRIHGSKACKDVSVSVKHFFPLLDLRFNPPSNLASHLQKKLQTIYPKVKALSLQGSKKAHRIFFPSFLARLTPNCKPAMKQEISACIIECLENEPQCYSVWRQMYSQHLTQSRELLNFINSNWSSLQSKLEKRLLADTISAFQRTNDEQKKADPELVSACKELQDKLNSKGFAYRYLVVLLLIAVCAIFAYDVYIHKSFRDSKTRKVLSDFGVLSAMEIAWRNINIYTSRINLWLQENVPYYYSKMAEVVEPYLILFWQKLYAGLLYLAEISAPYRTWLAEQAVQYIHWINAQLPWLYASVQHYATLAWQTSQYYAFHIATWLQTNVFTGSFSFENMSKVFVQIIQQLQAYAVQAVQYLSNFVGGQQSGTTSS